MEACPCTEWKTVRNEKVQTCQVDFTISREAARRCVPQKSWNKKKNALEKSLYYRPETTTDDERVAAFTKSALPKFQQALYDRIIRVANKADALRKGTPPEKGVCTVRLACCMLVDVSHCFLNRPLQSKTRTSFRGWQNGGHCGAKYESFRCWS